MTAIIDFLNTVFWGYVLIYGLLAVGLFFTFRLGFLQFRHFPEFIRSVMRSPEQDSGGITPFQALCTSLASRVGTGNLAGVAVAIALGGPGAIFWMWMVALVGMATAFAESTLAQLYKVRDEHGQLRGGPAFYIARGLKAPWAATLFSLCLILAFGLVFNAVQSNSIAEAMQGAFEVPKLVTGGAVALLAAVIIFGGIRTIARVAEYIVPFMAGAYLLVAIYVLIANYDAVPGMLALIVKSAFGIEQAAGGVAGAMLNGIKRGLFSNEAGEGSVPNAAATADVSHPIKQGLVQSFGVYVDTWIVCSATAFIVLLTGQYTIGGELTGIALAQASLASIFGPMAPAAISILILMFAFSSIVGNYYYGEINIAFFEGNTKKYLLLFRAGVVLMVFFGCMAELALVWNLADLFMGFLCLTNLYAVLRLSKYARIALFDYVKQKREGHKEPTFDPAILGDEDGVHAWGVDKIK